MWYLILLIVGIIIGIVIRTLWSSKKLDASGKILKDDTLTTEQKLAKLKELWKII